MAPFPETEIMTIKRLEVALRKMDFKLLKDGAYKLHEKYHSGYRFEYLDLLKELFMNISNNSSIPEDIKDILTPTIEDILSQQGIKADASSSPYESLNRDRVSSLTSLSYSTNSNETHEQTQKINAFNAFGAKHSETNTNSPVKYSQSPFSAQPFKEFSTPENSQQEPNGFKEYLGGEEKPQPQIQEPVEQVIEENPNTVQNQPEIQNAIPQAPQKTNTIAIFYGQDNSREKAKNIAKYQELISKMEDEHSSIVQILNLISEINTQTNVNVSELKNILDQLNSTQGKVNLVTNSSSAQLIGLFEENNYPYMLFDESNEAKINVLPIFGLSNLFVCENCAQEYLDKNTSITPLVLQCPKCKSPMFPNFYASEGKRIHLNIEYYNKALVALANSNIWLIVRPFLDEKTTINLLLNALKLNNSVEEIFILDKDINIRENCKKLFNEIKNNVKINTQINALEDFLNLVK